MSIGLFTGEDISLNGVVLNSLDESGCTWIIHDIEGWWNLPSLEIFDDPRTPYEDGSYYASGRYNPRSITITGRIIPPPGDVRPVITARNTLNNALNIVRETGEFIVKEGPDKMAYVQLGDVPLTSFNTIANHLEFSISLRAADPRKFSAESHVLSLPIASRSVGRKYARVFPQTYSLSGHSGRTAVLNDGTYVTDGFLRVHGPVKNPRIRHLGRGVYLKFDAEVGIDEYIEIDLQNRSITFSGGQPGRRFLTTDSEWFSIDPGVNILEFTGSTVLEPREYSPALVNIVKNPALADVNSNLTPDGVTIYGGIETYTADFINFDAPDNNRSVTYRRNATTAAEIRLNGYDVPTSTPYYSTVAASTTYNGSVWVKSSEPMSVRLRLVNTTSVSGSGTISASGLDGSLISLAAGEWTRLNANFAVPSSGWTSAALAIVIASGDGVVNGLLSVSSVQLTAGSGVWPYFDGDSAFSVWNGDPNNSTSSHAEVSLIPAPVIELTYRDAWIY